jgi:exonuclease III
MRRLRCDVLCLQETKASRSLLQQQPQAAAAHIDGWDSYWSCNVTERGGFNGVCTYARHAAVQEANARPFNDRCLDDEGRALVTVHGGLAIVNVYVPCGDGEAKTRFLKATREVACGLRSRGLHVVLLGDLNASRRARDTCFKWRYVSLAPPCPLLPMSVTSAQPRLLYAGTISRRTIHLT